VQSGLSGATQAQQHARIAEQINQSIAEGKKLIAVGHYAEALKIDSRAAEEAQRAGNTDLEAKAWFAISACQADLFSLRDAMRSAEKSYHLSLAAGNKTWAGGAAGNLANIYRTLGEYALAEKQSEEALRLLKDSARKDILAYALLFQADLSLEQGRFQEGMAFSDRAVTAAREAKAPDLEALVRDVRGFALLKANKLPDAEQALKEAQAIRKDGKETGWISVILGHRSELEFRKGNYAAALRLNDQAYATHSLMFTSVPSYYFVHVRGQILLALNEKPKALVQLRRAVDLANLWREAAVPGDSTNTQTVVYLNEVYHDFADLAAEMALEPHDPELSRQAWEALAQNRAASLREQLTAVLIRDSHLGDQFFKLLSELQTAQAHVTLGRNSPQDEAKLRSIRLELSELEDRSLTLSTKKEKYPFQNSLKGIQARLHPSEVLLSFCLGRTRSFLWAVTVNDVELHELPNEIKIEQRAKHFAEALQSGQNGDSQAVALSHMLFGQLSPRVWQKRNWLMTEDGALAGQIPYSALCDLSTAGAKQPLTAQHSLRSLPSELLLLIPDKAKPQRRFVGVADPIYNLADSRRIQDVRFVRTGATPTRATLGRLAGSDREVKAAAKLSGMPEKQLLCGGDATGAALRKALERSPELLHFAVHVVSPEGKPQEAALALSLTSDNMPELLTREAIATYRVPGSLVVLSGCSSGQGKALPSAGLIGLSRAWLLAGASAVVVSSWPIPDDSGEFFSAFYGHLQRTVTGSLAQRAATSLEEAQLDMQRSGGYRNSPSFWAAYSILSKE